MLIEAVHVCKLGSCLLDPIVMRAPLIAHVQLGIEINMYTDNNNSVSRSFSPLETDRISDQEGATQSALEPKRH